MKLGKRLSQETISQVEKLLTARVENTERNALRSAEIQTPRRQQQPATHSPFIKNSLQPPEVDEGNPLKMEKLINELTSALEFFRRRIRPRGERRIEPEMTEMTTQTQMEELRTGERTTQTEMKGTTTHHRITQTEATKRSSKGVGLQVQPPPLRSAKEAHTVLTASRRDWDRVHEKLQIKLAQVGF